MPITENDSIYVKAGKPHDPKYFDVDNLPYASIARVNERLPIAERHPWLTVSIAGKDYWYDETGTLVLKTLPGGGGGDPPPSTATALLTGGDYVRDPEAPDDYFSWLLPLATWIYGGTEWALDNFHFFVDAAAEGFTRVDIPCLTNTGTLALVVGLESAVGTDPPIPSVPAGYIPLRALLVSELESHPYNQDIPTQLKDGISGEIYQVSDEHADLLMQKQLNGTTEREHFELELDAHQDYRDTRWIEVVDPDTGLSKIAADVATHSFDPVADTTELAALGDNDPDLFDEDSYPEGWTIMAGDSLYVLRREAVSGNVAAPVGFWNLVSGTIEDVRDPTAEDNFAAGFDRDDVWINTASSPNRRWECLGDGQWKIGGVDSSGFVKGAPKNFENLTALTDWTAIEENRTLLEVGNLAVYLSSGTAILPDFTAMTYDLIGAWNGKLYAWVEDTEGLNNIWAYDLLTGDETLLFSDIQLTAAPSPVMRGNQMLFRSLDPGDSSQKLGLLDVDTAAVTFFSGVSDASVITTIVWLSDEYVMTHRDDGYSDVYRVSDLSFVFQSSGIDIGTIGTNDYGGLQVFAKPGSTTIFYTVGNFLCIIDVIAQTATFVDVPDPDTQFISGVFCAAWVTATSLVFVDNANQFFSFDTTTETLSAPTDLAVTTNGQVRSLHVVDGFMYSYEYVSGGGTPAEQNQLFKRSISDLTDLTNLTVAEPVANLRLFASNESARFFLYRYNFTTNQQAQCVLDTADDSITELDGYADPSWSSMLAMDGYFMLSGFPVLLYSLDGPPTIDALAASVWNGTAWESFPYPAFPFVPPEFTFRNDTVRKAILDFVQGGNVYRVDNDLIDREFVDTANKIRGGNHYSGLDTAETFQALVESAYPDTTHFVGHSTVSIAQPFDFVPRSRSLDLQNGVTTGWEFGHRSGDAIDVLWYAQVIQIDSSDASLGHQLFLHKINIGTREVLASYTAPAVSVDHGTNSRHDNCTIVFVGDTLYVTSVLDLFLFNLTTLSFSGTVYTTTEDHGTGLGTPNKIARLSMGLYDSVGNHLMYFGWNVSETYRSFWLKFDLGTLAWVDVQYGNNLHRFPFTTDNGNYLVVPRYHTSGSNQYTNFMTKGGVYAATATITGFGTIVNAGTYSGSTIYQLYSQNLVVVDLTVGGAPAHVTVSLSASLTSGFNAVSSFLADDGYLYILGWKSSTLAIKLLRVNPATNAITVLTTPTFSYFFNGTPGDNPVLLNGSFLSIYVHTGVLFLISVKGIFAFDLTTNEQIDYLNSMGLFASQDVDQPRRLRHYFGTEVAFFVDSLSGRYIEYSYTKQQFWFQPKIYVNSPWRDQQGYANPQGIDVTDFLLSRIKSTPPPATARLPRTTDTPIDKDERVIQVNASGGAVAYDLSDPVTTPPASGSARRITFTRVDNTPANALTVTPVGYDDGTVTLSNRNDQLTLEDVQTAAGVYKWIIISKT